MSAPSLSPPIRTHRRSAWAVMRIAALSVALLSAAACSSAATSAPSPSATAFHGDKLSQPIELSAQASAARFRATTGGTTTLGALQRGNLMLVYFGYTHCPDVCPTTMADLGQAVRQLPTQAQTHTQVVFVTSDPARDTPAVMTSWLHNFDSGLLHPFVGLTASIKAIDAVATSVGVPLEAPRKEANGTITVQHGAETLAFIDGKAGVLWTGGTNVADYVHDLNVLIRRVGSQ
ncbi:MAG: SCO family protein [Jatrophihabitans sp.]